MSTGMSRRATQARADINMSSTAGTAVRGGRLVVVGCGAAAGLLAGLLTTALVAVAGGPGQAAAMAGLAAADGAATWLAIVVLLSAVMGIVYVWLFPPD